ncbi:MAG TPA: hypothetical protein PLR41_10105 [Alphaproteobacteria bacterium]|nr:hypothetical protein [Alphaproteobacteria bacterium]
MDKAAPAAEPARELWAELFVERLASDIKASLSPEQMAEIRRVARDVAPGQHRVDWRVSLPLFGPLFGGKRVYGVLLAGAERRGPARRQQDRMMRRRPRASAAQLNAQVLAVGFSLMALFFMALLGLTHVG